MTDQLWQMDIEAGRLAAIPTGRGEGPTPVVFLHGIGGSPYYWTPDLTAPFEAVGPGLSLALPGHFPAAFPPDFPAEGLTPAWFARVLAAAIRQWAGGRRVLLVGHSTGGFCGLCLAIHAPETVAGLVAIAGFARGRWTGAMGINQWLVRQGPLGRRLFKGIYGLAGRSRYIYRSFWQALVHDRRGLAAYPYLDALVDCTFPPLRHLDLQAMQAYFIQMPRIDITSDLARITAPACVIAGKNDPIVPPAQAVTIAGQIGGAQLSLIPGAGHVPFIERPAEYRRAVEAWLAGFKEG